MNLLENPPSVHALREWIKILDVSAGDLLRPRSATVKAQGDLTGKSSESLLQLMASDGDTIRRPVLIGARHGVLGASEESLRAFLKAVQEEAKA